MKKRFSEDQIINILNESKTGISTEEICRKYGICKMTFYKWKSKFGGMTISESKRLKSLECENSKLKKLVAEQALDIVALKDVLSRKW